MGAADAARAKAGAAPKPASDAWTPAEVAARVDDTLRKADKDGDRRLSMAEIKSAMGDRESIESLELRTKKFDRDGDKYLNPTEIGEVLKAMANR